MAAQAFPPIQPTGRSYSPGAFPQSEFKALNGATTVIRYGNRRSNSELRLTFQNISDANAATLLALYEQTMTTDDWIAFTAADGAAGASPDLANYLREVGGSGLRWRFAEPPTVDSVVPGRSSVQCSFKGYRDPS
jgi:hypothetical protein